MPIEFVLTGIALVIMFGLAYCAIVTLCSPSLERFGAEAMVIGIILMILGTWLRSQDGEPLWPMVITFLGWAIARYLLRHQLNVRGN